MIVVAIIGILAAIAIPAYTDYTKRARITEGFNLMATAKVGIAEYYAVNGTFPVNNAQAGIAEYSEIKGNSVGSLQIYGNNDASPKYGEIEVVFKEEIFTPILNIRLQATDSDGSLAWSCYTGSSENKRFLPADCRKNTP